MIGLDLTVPLLMNKKKKKDEDASLKYLLHLLSCNDDRYWDQEKDVHVLTLYAH